MVVLAGKRQRLSYIAELDSFRFFAVLLVIFSHWLPNTIVNIIPNGFLGVTFFFVLSGFLISSNLLYTKKRIDAKKIALSKALKLFYIRRTLRIFPLYFVVLLLLFVLIPAVFDNQFIWYVTYLPNFLIDKLQAWPGMLSHFWSLAVEEQFYLLWPFLLLLLPYKWLKYFFPAVIVLSILFKVTLYQKDAAFFNYYDVLPLSCFDAFGIGAMLAYYLIENRDELLQLGHRVSVLPGFIVAAMLMAVIYRAGYSFLFGAAVSLTSVMLILKAISGYKGVFQLILSNPVLQYLGKISYGLYVYHNFIPWMVRCITGRETVYPIKVLSIKADWLQGAVPLFFVHSLLLVAVATISWFLMEKPINNLKRYFF